MKLLGKCLLYSCVGIGIGAVCYLSILTFIYPGVAPTVLGLISVFVISALIGLLSMIFETDMPFTYAIGIHLVGTFLLYVIMNLINNWPINRWTVFIFVLVYLIVWLIVILTQGSKIHRLNMKIKQRNSKQK